MGMQAELDFMHERDRIRLEGLIPKAVQCDPIVSTIAIQTEFITPDVSPCVCTVMQMYAHNTFSLFLFSRTFLTPEF